MNLSTDIWTWVMAFIMLSLFSFLWKENPFSKIGESIYVGAASGFMLAQGFNQLKNMAIYPITEGRISLVVPIFLGLLFFTRFSTKYSFLSRYASALPLGLGAGIALRAIPSAQILSQIRATLVPLNSIDNFLILVGVVTTISYFLYTTEQNKSVRGLGTIGMYFMMITFGLTFATAVFQHVAIYFGTLQLLLGDWLGLI